MTKTTAKTAMATIAEPIVTMTAFLFGKDSNNTPKTPSVPGNARTSISRLGRSWLSEACHGPYSTGQPDGPGSLGARWNVTNNPIRPPPSRSQPSSAPNVRYSIRPPAFAFSERAIILHYRLDQTIPKGIYDSVIVFARV